MPDGLSDAFFRALFHSQLGGIAVADIPSATIIEINEVLLGILGCGRDDIVGRPNAWVEFTPPEYRHLDEQGMLQIAEKGYSDAFEKEYQRPDGTRIPVRVSATIVPNFPDRLIVYVFDISQAQAAKNREVAIQQRLQIALSASQQGVWDYDLVSGLMTYSDRAKEIYGVPADQPVTFEQIRDATHPEDLPVTLAQFERAIDPKVRDRSSYEYRIVLPDGTVRWTAAFGEALFAGSGSERRPVRYVGTIQDITGRKNAERRQIALFELDEQLRDVANTANISFVASKLLGEAVGAVRVGYGVIDSEAHTIAVERNWSAPGFSDVAGLHDFEDYGTYIAELIRGEAVANSDVRKDPRTSANVAPFQALGIAAHLDVPVIEKGQPVAEIFVHSDVPRVWSPDEVAFVREVAQRTHSAIARRGAEEKRRETEARFRAVFDSQLIGLAIFDVNSGDTETINDRFLEMTGHSRADFDQGRWDWRDFTIPEYLPLDEAAITQARERGRWDPYEKEYQALNGRRFPVRISSAELPGFRGKLVVSVEDISDRKRWEEHQRLLIGELNHRVKNSLAIVQSLAHQTFPKEPAVQPFLAAYEQRLLALAATHNLLTQANWESADLHELISGSLRIHGWDTGRVSVTGERIALTPQAAVSLSMAVHELATNALKYGALSDDHGSVEIRWEKTTGGLTLIWQEHGGPEVKTPAHRGFGSRMIERALSSSLDGQASLYFEPSGVRCVITAPATILA